MVNQQNIAMKKNLPCWIPSYGIVIYTLVLAVLIAFIPDRSVGFLLALVLNFVFCILNRNFFSHSAVGIFRILVGLLFIFSSISKGVDPLGTKYVIHDYLEAYGMPWLTGLSLLGSFILNMLEFAVGVLLLLNVKFKWTVLLTSLMMIFFTVTTWYDAVANPVPDCGCFGKALVITNWQTFYKNLVIDAAVLVLFFYRNRVRNTFSSMTEWVVIGVTVLGFLGFEYYNYRYLPVLNFLEWKEGGRLFPEELKPVEHYVTYKNKLTGETKEYLLKECPYGDSVWLAEWEFVDRRDVDPNPAMVNINILEKLDDEDPGVDVTKDLLMADRYAFLIVMHDLDEANIQGVEKVAEFVKEMESAGYESFFLTASPVARAMDFASEYGLEDFRFYYSDNTAVKAVIRNNPGIVLLRNSTVLKLWDWRRLPEASQVDFAALSQEYGWE